jgi:predicted nucleic acid-binding protein
MHITAIEASTDWMSMVIMEINGVQDILTSDRHFTQAGFRILM